MLNEKEKREEIIRLGNMMSQSKDMDLLMERILTEARHFVNADAGSIYRVEGDCIRLKYSQNDTKQKELRGGKKLIYNTFKIPINHKTISGYVAGTGEILNIPDVYVLPKDVPFSFGLNYDKLTGYKTTSMLTLPLKTHRGEIIGVLQMINAKDENEKVIAFSPDDIPLINYFANTASAAIERAELTRTIILRTIKTAQLRDPKETGPHVNRVGAYSAELYEAWALRKGLPAAEIEYDKDGLRMAAMLHDVGKVGISDLILKKTAKLTPEEYDIMKEHTFLGARLFSDSRSEFDEKSVTVVLNHHERWDGRGYPGYIDVETGKPIPGYEDANGKAIGRKSEEIPIFGRIVAVADVYDALSSKRVYKDAWSQDDVLAELKKQSGTQFDPDIIDVFFANIELIQSITKQYIDED